MTYKYQLYPWCIVRHSPNMQHRIVCRLRNRSDAEGHLKILRQLMPKLHFSIVFDLTPTENNPPTNPKSKIQ